MRQLSDTSDEARKVLTEAYRALSPARKLRMISEEFRLAYSIHHAGWRRLHPTLSESEIQESWRSMILGHSLSGPIKGKITMSEELDNLAVLRQVLAAFEDLSIPYALGGSWASSYYGEARMTRDADISVDPFPGKEQLLADQFGADYYLSVNAIRESNRQRSAFNIIHTSTAFKVDVFVRKSDPFETSVMARRRPGDLEEGPEAPIVWVSPEDIVLLKLRWYRLGNEISDRQWNDVLNVLRIQSGRLDEEYLTHWSKEINVADLLTKARAESS